MQILLASLTFLFHRLRHRVIFLLLVCSKVVHMRGLLLLSTFDAVDPSTLEIQFELLSSKVDVVSVYYEFW